MQQLYHNGIILTLNKRNPVASAMVVTESLISSVGGSELLEIAKDAEKIDLKGRTIIPGLNDAHIHIWKVGQLESFIVDLRGIESITALQAKIKTYASQLPNGTWIMGRGFNEQVLAEKRMPEKEDLDVISKEHPIYLIRTCAHIAVVNNLALQLTQTDVTTTSPEGGVIGKRESGELTGIFYETALGLITRHIPSPAKDEYKRMIKAGEKKLISNGITSATDPAVHPELLEAYLELHNSNDLLLRANLMPILLPDGGDKPYALPEKFVSEGLRVDTVKFFSDGGLSGKTAALSRPYKNSSDKGVLRLKYDQFFNLAKIAQIKGFRVGTHAIGDVAIELVLEVYKALYEQFGSTRNRIEHFGLPTDKNIADISHYGFVAIPQPIFLDELGENFINALDGEYLTRCYPVKSLLDKNIRIAFSTDAPVVKNLNPFSCMKAAVTRKTNAGNVISREESISIEEALSAYTIGSAFAEGTEAIKGSIEVGKLADFVILNRNPLEVRTEELDAIEVEATYIGGVCCFQKQ